MGFFDFINLFGKKREAREESKRKEKGETEKTIIEVIEREVLTEMECKEVEHEANEDLKGKEKEETDQKAWKRIDNSNNTKDEVNRTSNEIQITNFQLLDGLNERQRNAVVATEGRVRIVAGAGSGKTRVLAHRYAYLIEKLGIDPSHILCMTFTNKAASEMKTRISKLVQSFYVNDFVCTVHGFCVKFLRQEIYRIGYPQNFQIIDEEDSKAFAKQIMEELGLDRTKSTIRKFLDSIGIMKNLSWRTYVDDLMIPNANIKEEYKENEFVQYILLQKKYNALDFDDLIHFTLFILNNFPDVREYWSKRFNYIQVDEVQDCNNSDWDIINALSSYYNNLFIVGDPDQAIYEWRGAKPNTFVEFIADTDIILNQNYRSTPDILNVANSIIVNNENRIKKDLVTSKSAGSIVIHNHSKSENEEGDWIATQIENLKNEGADNADFAILYRASYLSRCIEQALMRKDLSYTIWGGIRFFERKEIKDCICYLKLIAYNDDMAFRRVINEPSRKFGKVTLDKLDGIAKMENMTLYDTLKAHIQDKTFNKPSYVKFVNVIEKAKDISLSASIPDLMDYILENTGLKEMYRMEDNEERLENITELINSMKLYNENNAEEEMSLEKYLQDIALYTNADYKKDGTMIKLMTIHQSKGLEFPYVFVCGLSEGIFPSYKTIQERKRKGLEEERRLMYVAITRAEKALFLTESEGFNVATKEEKRPSRFLLEITKELIEVKGKIDPQLLNRTIESIRRIDYDICSPEFKYQVGDIISHDHFGSGEIVECNEQEQCCRVKFEIGDRNVRYDAITMVVDKKEIKQSASKTPHNSKIQKIHVNDIIYDSDWSSVVLEVIENEIKVYNFKEKKIKVLKKKDFYTVKFRPQKDAFYRVMKPAKKGEEIFLYVKDFYFTKDEIRLCGVLNKLGARHEFGISWIDKLNYCSKEDFLSHCVDVELFEEYRKTPNEPFDDSNLLAEFMKLNNIL